MCLQTGTHYTDITGEHQVFEELAAYDNRAKEAGIAIMPGTGFDVVPSDCLALYLKQALPSPRHLLLAFKTSQGGVSRGTAKTMLAGLGRASVIRRNGKLVSIPMGEKVKKIDFGLFRATCLNIPWGDVSTAWHSTGIPNIEVYMAASKKAIVGAKISRYLHWLLLSPPVQKYLAKKVQIISGPGEEKRKAARSFLWGRVCDDAGNSYTAALDTVNGYSLTASTSVLIAESLAGSSQVTGFQTPAMAFGPDLILKIPDTVRRTL
jgi:short subunit dehydrogenase-like uncharacterized protein